MKSICLAGGLFFVAVAAPSLAAEFGQAALSLNPPVFEGQKVTVSGALDFADGPLSFEWGDKTKSTSELPAVHEYAKEGTYTVKIEAKIQQDARRQVIHKELLLYAGGSPIKRNLHQLRVRPAVVDGRLARINGAVQPPVDRIEWRWDDRATEKHHFFPNTHEYKAPGKYLVQVATYDSKGVSVQYVQVEIKE